MENVGAMVTIALVGLVLPIGLLLLAFLFDLVVVLWAASRVWHDGVTRGWQIARRVAHVPHWHFVRSR